MYIVIEIQTKADGTVDTLVTSFTERSSAESAYYNILASAAISVLPMHAAIFADNEGLVIESKCYKHERTIGAE